MACDPDLAKSLERLEGKVDVNSADIKELKKDVGVLKSDVKTLKRDLKVVKTDLNGVKQEVSKIQILHEAMDARFDQLCEIIQPTFKKQEQIGKNEKRIGNLEGRTSTLESVVRTHIAETHR